MTIGLQFDKENLQIAASILLIGSLTGSLVGGLQVQFLGRKKSLLFDNVCMIARFGMLDEF